MGFKARPKKEERQCSVVITRTDGYSLHVDNLSYDAGLAVVTVLNRVTQNLPVKVSWADEENDERFVKVLPMEMSEYACGKCGHRWKGPSTMRDGLKFTTHVNACPECLSSDIIGDETLRPYKRDRWCR